MYTPSTYTPTRVSKPMLRVLVPDAADAYGSGAVVAVGDREVGHELRDLAQLAHTGLFQGLGGHDADGDRYVREALRALLRRDDHLLDRSGLGEDRCAGGSDSGDDGGERLAGVRVHGIPLSGVWLWHRILRHF
jgi:hypothetical protein